MLYWVKVPQKPFQRAIKDAPPLKRCRRKSCRAKDLRCTVKRYHRSPATYCRSTCNAVVPRKRYHSPPPFCTVVPLLRCTFCTSVRAFCCRCVRCSIHLLVEQQPLNQRVLQRCTVVVERQVFRTCAGALQRIVHRCTTGRAGRRPAGVAGLAVGTGLLLATFAGRLFWPLPLLAWPAWPPPYCSVFDLSSGIGEWCRHLPSFLFVMPSILFGHAVPAVAVMPFAVIVLSLFCIACHLRCVDVSGRACRHHHRWNITDQVMPHTCDLYEYGLIAVGRWLLRRRHAAAAALYVFVLRSLRWSFVLRRCCRSRCHACHIDTLLPISHRSLPFCWLHLRCH